MNQLLRRNHDELSGFVIGHLMNCVLFSRSPIYVQAPLLCSMLDRLKEFVWLAGAYDVTGQDRQSDKLSVGSSLSEHRVGAECSPSTYLRTRNSSWSDDARSDVSQARSTPEEEYKKEVFSACGVVTVVLSVAYCMTNPYLVLLAVGAFASLVFAVYATHTQKWECGESVMA